MSPFWTKDGKFILKNGFAVGPECPCCCCQQCCCTTTTTTPLQTTTTIPPTSTTPPPAAAAPCTSCTGSGHEDAIITGLTSAAGNRCNQDFSGIAFNNFISRTDNCEWWWRQSYTGESCSGNPDDDPIAMIANVHLLYFKANDTYSLCDPSFSMLEGEWLIQVRIYDNLESRLLQLWMEKTTGFVCSDLSGKISGTHTFTTTQATGCGNSCVNACDPNNTPTVTVPV